MAPISPAKITPIVEDVGLHDVLRDRGGDRRAEDQERGEVEERRPRHGLARREDPGGHDGGDRVRRVVEAVEEVERERDRDDQDDGQTSSRATRA